MEKEITFLKKVVDKYEKLGGSGVKNPPRRASFVNNTQLFEIDWEGSGEPTKISAEQPRQRKKSFLLPGENLTKSKLAAPENSMIQSYFVPNSNEMSGSKVS